MITSALPPLLWVLALGNIVHLLTRHARARAAAGPVAAAEQAVAATWRPCTLAALTTAAGFASLLAAPMQPVRELGALAAAGILVSLAVNLSLGPLLLVLLRVPGSRLGPRSERPLAWPALTRPVTVLAVAVVFLVLCAAAVPRIRVASDPLTFLPPDHSTVQAYRAVEGRIGGFYTLEVMLQLDHPFWEPEQVALLERLGDQLAASPIVARVLGPLDLVRQLAFWEGGLDPAHYRVPAEPAETAALIAGLDVEGRAILATLVTPDGRTARLSAVVDEMDEGRFLELVGQAEAALAELPDGTTGAVTGQVLQLVEAQQALVSTQLRSLAMALVLVFACLGIGLRSWRLTALSVLPNLLPLLAAFALMAVLGWPLDAATVMVASVALGIAVDNTAHMLEGFRRQLAAGDGPSAAAANALRQIGPAMAVTTVTAVVGFLSLTVSAFVPIRDFGLLAAAAMVVALAGDTLLLPALLVWSGRR
jgi:predicted RND superfamily exporter protein